MPNIFARDPSMADFRASNGCRQVSVLDIATSTKLTTPQVKHWQRKHQLLVYVLSEFRDKRSKFNLQLYIPLLWSTVSLPIMVTVDISLDNELRDGFMAIRISILAAVNQEDRRATFQHQLHDLTSRAAFAISNNLLSSETTHLIRSVALEVYHLSATFLEWCDASSRIRADLLAEPEAKYKRILGLPAPPRAGPPLKLPKSSKQQQLQDLTAEMTKFRPCRDFFLSHIGSPYPSASEKKGMAQHIGCEVASVSQWFTNHRRRSSWMTVMKEHAGNDKATMQKLAQAVVAPDASTKDVPVSDATRNAILAVRAYFEKITTPSVSPEFMELVNQPPMTDEELAAYRARRKQIRRVRMEVKRAIAGKLVSKQERRVKAAEGVAPMVPSVGKRKRNSEDTPPGE